MADLSFDTAFDRILGNEGGYVFNEEDPGGETNWGISKRQYPDVDIKNLTKEQAKAIYLRDFWNPLGYKVHDAVKYQVFDAAVNHGPSNAIRMLQRAIGVADDGHWGPISATAYANIYDTPSGGLNDMLLRFTAERIEFDCALNKFSVFGRGWMRRIAKNLRYAALDN